MNYREIMMQNDENLSWCKPLFFDSDKVIIAVNETGIVGIQIDGVDTDITPAEINAVARRVNEEYDEYKGWDDKHIILDADYRELPCRLCPWFGICDAMDAEYTAD